MFQENESFLGSLYEGKAQTCPQIVTYHGGVSFQLPLEPSFYGTAPLRSRLRIKRCFLGRIAKRDVDHGSLR